jgi:drug/metabolite transporter (DMT)-like permease
LAWVLGHTLYQLFFINGLARTTPANASLLMATSPIFVIIYGRLLGIERTNRLVWGGICLSFVGILLLVIGGGGDVRLGGTTILGDVLVLAAAMLWAAYTTGSKSLLARYSPLKLTTASMAFGTIPLILVSVPAILQQDWGAPTTGGAGLLYSAIFSVAIACRLVHQPARATAHGRILESYSGLLGAGGLMPLRRIQVAVTVTGGAIAVGLVPRQGRR